jgi:ABC-type lipoprotein export system ATPase subunit
VDNSLILEAHNLEYTYQGGSTLRFPSVLCKRNGSLLIAGNSGKGKTTLLHLLSGLLKVQQGEVRLAGRELSTMSQSELDKYRGRHIGLVFQQPRFVGSLSVVQNVAAAQYFGLGSSNSKEAMALLDELGIASYANKRSAELSGGERQRLAIACALASKPEVVMADEPTSSLDDDNANVVYDLMVRECQKNGAALVVVSHDQRLKAKFHDKVVL